LPLSGFVIAAAAYQMTTTNNRICNEREDAGAGHHFTEAKKHVANMPEYRGS